MNLKSGSGRGNKFLITAIGIVAVAVFGLLFFFISRVLATDTYYQLNTDVLAKQPIDETMVNKVSTKKGTAPTNAVTLADIQSGGMVSKYPLPAYEVLTTGNAGAATDTLYDLLIAEKESTMKEMELTEEEYDNWVMTSFSVDASNAVDGRISVGDYFDIMVVTDNGAWYPFINVKAIDTTVSLDNASSSQAVDSSEAYSGQTTRYTVRVAPDEAAKLQWIMTNYDNVKLLLNSKSDVVVQEGEKVAKALAGGTRKYNGFGVGSLEKRAGDDIMRTISLNIVDDNYPSIIGDSESTANRLGEIAAESSSSRQEEARQSSAAASSSEATTSAAPDGEGDTPAAGAETEPTE